MLIWAGNLFRNILTSYSLILSEFVFSQVGVASGWGHVFWEHFQSVLAKNTHFSHNATNIFNNYSYLLYACLVWNFKLTQSFLLKKWNINGWETLTNVQKPSLSRKHKLKIPWDFIFTTIIMVIIQKIKWRHIMEWI